MIAGTIGQTQISLERVCKNYPTPAGPYAALRDITLSISPGEYVAVVGASGCGKSTLVNLLTGIDSVSSGSVRVGDTDLQAMSQDELAVWRGRSIGLVFQFFQLLPSLSVVENVMLPMDFCAVRPSAERRGVALRLLERLGIPEQADKLPADLSGGQQQRAAIARALANDPPILVADEPTGNLDSATAKEVIRLFAGLAEEGKTVVTVTHERDLSSFFSRVITLADGMVVGGTQVSP